MSRVKVGEENGDAIEINYYDHGQGTPVVLIHGYPLDARSWEKQERVLLDAGYRVVSYDRRGFGQSTQATVGYDYDTFAGDLKTLLEHLDLREVVLVGHSMGTGEIARYLGTYGSGRVTKAVLIETLPPYFGWAGDNPEGVDRSGFEATKAAIIADRPAWFKVFLDDFFNADTYLGNRVSQQAWDAAFSMSLAASAYAALACVDTWVTDFREDLGKIDVPVLLIHGDDDRVLPYAATAARLPALVKDLTVVDVVGGPHNTPWTHPEVVNPALLDFIAE